MKKVVLITIIGVIIVITGHSVVEMMTFANCVKQDTKISNIKLIEFKNGRWISTTDSLAGIEITDGKWIMFYKGIEVDSTDIYDFKIRKQYSVQHEPIEYLTITTQQDTLEYSILEYSPNLLSLMYIPRGNILNYIPEQE